MKKTTPKKRGIMVNVSGQAGCGKTRLIKEIIDKLGNDYSIIHIDLDMSTIAGIKAARSQYDIVIYETQQDIII